MFEEDVGYVNIEAPGMAAAKKTHNSLHIISVKEVLLLMCSVFERKVTFNSFGVTFFDIFFKRLRKLNRFQNV